MKTLPIILALIVLLSGVAMANETVWIPFWQHDSVGIETFFLVGTIDASEEAVVQLTVYDDAGTTSATTNPVTLDNNDQETVYWETSQTWYSNSSLGNDLGMAKIEITDTTADIISIYVACYGAGEYLVTANYSGLYGSGS